MTNVYLVAKDDGDSEYVTRIGNEIGRLTGEGYKVACNIFDVSYDSFHKIYESEIVIFMPGWHEKEELRKLHARVEGLKKTIWDLKEERVG